MAATASQRRQQTSSGVALAGISNRPLAERDQRPRLHPAELRRRTTATSRSSRRRPRARQTIWKKLNELFVEERKKGVLDVSQIPSSITAHAPGYIDRDNEIIVGLQTDAPLKRAIMPNGGFRMVANALKTYGYEPDPHVVEAFTKYRKTHNDGGLRRLHRRRPALPQLAHPHRPARRLRPRPDHRRLPPRRALRRRPADRAQAGGEEQRSTPSRRPTRSSATARSCPSRSARSRNCRRWPRATASTSRGPARTAQRSRAVALLRLPRRREGAERRGDVARPHVDVPRHLLRARPRGRHAHRGAGAGDHRRLRHQAAHRPLPAHAGIRRAVRRRSDLGDRVDRRHGRRRPVAGDEDELPHPADALQPRPGAGAEPDDLVLAAPARRVPALRRQGGDRHQLAPVRERRDHAPRLGRRRRHRLLRVADAGRQADAVLRRARQPRQVPALRDQRRPRRDQRQAGRPRVRAGARATYLDFDDVLDKFDTDDGLAGRRLRQRHEHHPLHARQVRLRADRDGAARLRAAAHDGVRHGRHVGRRRQPVGDQVREGAGGPRRDRPDHRLPDRRRRSRCSATTTTASTSSPSGWSAPS